MAYGTEYNNTIWLTRGDTLELDVVLEDYTPQAGDTIRFALKRDQLNISDSEYLDDTPLIVKNIPTGTMKLHLDPADTKDLGFGRYVYDIELTYEDGTVDTFITASPFILAREVH